MEVVNSNRLKILVERAGGSTTVAYEADVGQSTLEKMMAGSYRSFPGRKLRKKLFKYFKVPESFLFNLEESSGEIAS